MNINKKGGYNHWTYDFEKIKRHLELSAPNQCNARFVSAPLTHIYEDYWKLPWDDFIICSDAHIPHLNERISNLMLDIAVKHNIKHIIHAGDFFDGETFSKWPAISEFAPGFAYEIEYAKDVVKSWLSVFKEIHFTMGTHDLRFWRQVKSAGKDDKQNALFDLLGDKRIKVSSYFFAEINHEWRCTHPKSVTKAGGFPSVRMCAKHRRSISFAHGHWLWMTRDPSSQHWMVGSGCLVDPRRIAYKTLLDASWDEWNPGFILVRDKIHPTLIYEGCPAV